MNFVVFGLCLLGCTIALHLAVRRSRAGVVGPAIMGVTGAVAVLVGWPSRWPRTLPGAQLTRPACISRTASCSSSASG